MQLRRGAVSAPPERLECCQPYDLWVVVGFTQVSEHQHLCAAVVIIGQELGGGVVGKVSVPAHDTLFDEPGIRPNAQHLRIVIRLKDERVATEQVLFDMLRDIA